MIFAKFCLSVTVGTAFLVLEIAPAIALSPPEISQAVKHSIVRIITDTGSVSGTIIKQQGFRYTVLTTSRIIDNTSRIKIITSDGNSHSIIKSGDYVPSSGVELAVLRFNSKKTYKSVTVSDPISLPTGINSNNIFIAGYPQSTETITSPVYSLRTGTQKQSITLKGGYTLSYKANLLPGMEGGGIFDSNGVMIGVNGYSLKETNRPDAINPNISFQDGSFTGIAISAFTSLPSSRSNGDYTPPSDFTGENSNSAPDVNALRTTFADIQILGQAGEHLRRGRYQQAIQGYSTYISSHPKEALAYGHRGNAKLKAGDKRGAIADYDMAMILNPSLAEVLRNRAIAKASVGDRAGALADAEKTVQIQPNNPEYLYLLGLAYFENGRRAESVKVLTQAAIFYQQQGNISQATKVNVVIERIKRGDS
jgi:serine protease Do